MDGLGFIFIYVLALAAGIIYFLRMFKKIDHHKPIQNKSSSSDKPKPPSKTIPLLDFITGLALMCWGQYLVALPGYAFYPLSRWLNSQLLLDTINLDNVLFGLPFLWAGCYFIILAFNQIGFFDNKNKFEKESYDALPFRIFKDKIARAIAAGLIFSLLLVFLANKQYNGFLPVMWVGSILAICALAWQWDRQSKVSLSTNLARTDLLWITALVLTGLVVASYSLQSIPNQMIGDEGNFWTTARDIANGSYQPPVFGFGVYTFGILSSIFQGFVLRIFGINFWSWRFSSVLSGIAAVPPLYLLGRELFNRRVAVASSFAMFTAPYFLAFARLGYNNIQTLFVVTLAFYLFYIGFQRKSAFYLFLAGCAAGLGVYTYSAASGAFLIIVLILVISLFQRSTNKRVLLKTAAIFLVGWLIVSVPYSVYGHATAPDSFSIKPLESIFFNTGFGQDLFGAQAAFAQAPRFSINQTTLFFSPLLYAIMLLRAAFRTLIAFNNPFLINQHFIISPLAGPAAVVFYTVGSVLALFRLHQKRFAYLIIWFGFNLFAFSMVDTFPPRYQHTVGIIPVMALFIGLGMVACVDVLAGLIPHISRLARNTLLAVLILGVGFSGVYNYFVSMPAVYLPDFQQIIAWYGLYAKGQSIDYVYNNQESPDFKPYTIREIRKDVPFNMIPAADFAAHPEKYPLSQGTLLFYAPASANQVLPALENNYGDRLKEIEYENLRGQPIGAAAWLNSMPIALPITTGEVLADSYLRPVGWLVLFLALLLLFFAAYRPEWRERSSAWLSARKRWFTKEPLQIATASSGALILADIAINQPTGTTELANQPDIQFPLAKQGESRPLLIRFTTALQTLVSQEKWIAILVIASVIVLAFYGEQAMLDQHLQPGIWCLLSAGIVFLLYSLVYGYVLPAKASQEITTEYIIPSPEIRRGLIFFAALIAIINLFLLHAHNPQKPYWDSFGLWLVSILLFLLAFLPKLHLNHFSLNLQKHWKKWLPLALILLTGLAARFYQLGSIPNTMENDEGKVGVESLKVLSGVLPNMFQTWEGYGTLHFFLMALPVKLFGQTRFGIRFDTALYGFLVLPVVYILARKMFGHRVALVSTALLAVSHLHIQFSRVSPSASSLDPLLAALSFLLVYYGLKSRLTILWALAGVVMGLGFYFYVGARVLIVILIGLLIWLLIFNRSILKGNGRNLIVLAGAFLIIATPMLNWFITNPNTFNARMNQVGIIQNGWLALEMQRQNLPAWRILLQQFGNSLLIFNYFNPRWFYNALVPALGPVSGAAFVGGLLASLARLRDPRFALLNSWFWVTLITGQVLVVDPTANAYRTLGLIPAVCILAGFALVRLADGLFSQWPKNFGRIAPVLILTMVLVFEGGWNIWNYFGVWAPQNRYSDPNSQLASLIGDYLGQQPAGAKAYVADINNFSAAGWMSIEYLRKSTPFEDIQKPMDRALASLKLASRTVFIFPIGRENELAVVQQAFPGGQVVRKYLGKQLLFTAYQK